MTASDTFPDSWAILRFPQMRCELLEYLHDLSDSKYQEEHWRKPQTNPALALHTLGNALKEIIDMRGYDQDEFITAAVGGELFDIAEANAVKRLCHTLIRIIRSLRQAPDASYLAHPEWPKVISEASEAYQLMRDR
jgi:hypothetical protein